MSQQIWTSINPATTSGNQLADLLNNFKDAMVSGLSGTSRPSTLQAGGFWIDTTNDSSGLWDFKIYDGSEDITIFTINKDANSASVFSTDSQFEIRKETDDAIGPILKLKKSRANNGQTLDSDSIGDFEWYGVRDDSTEELMARFRVESTDNVTSGAHGTRVIFEGTDDNGATLKEYLRIIDGKLGLGVTAPAEKIHTNGNVKTLNNSDTTNPAKFISHKKRVSNQGQVLSGDSITKYEAKSHDNADSEFEVANFELAATENHTNSARGAEWTLRTILNGSTSLTNLAKFGSSITLLRNLIADLVGGSVQNPTRLDVKKDTEANLETYASTASNGQWVFATDTKTMFQIIDNELSPAGSGGGGVSLLWEKNTNNAPFTSFEDGITLHEFDSESEQEIYALIPVPQSYRAGDQIFLKRGKFVSSGTSGNVLFSGGTKLLTDSSVIGSLGSEHTSVNTELTLSTPANELTDTGDIDLTDASGQVAGVAVAPGNKLLVRLFRNNSSETASATEAARLLINSFDIVFS